MRALPDAEMPAPDSQAQASAYRLDRVGLDFASAEGRRAILRDASLEIGTGELVGIVGRSGTGKTSLLRILGGLLRPTTGQVLLDGEPLLSPTGTVVMVFQDYGEALLPWRKVGANVALGIEGHMSREERRARVDQALRMVHLADRVDEYPWRLSGGMQQRVQLARALAVRPRVLLMDEPFGALDAMTKAALQDQLLGVRERTGTTVVFVTHDIEEAVYLSDRVLVLNGQPGTISCSLATELPRERDQIATRELPRYLEVRHRVSEALRED